MEQSKAPESFEIDLRRIVTTTIRASASPTNESRTISRTEGFTVASVTCRSEKFGLISGNDHTVVLHREESTIGFDSDGVVCRGENPRFAVGDDTQHGLVARRMPISPSRVRAMTRLASPTHTSRSAATTFTSSVAMAYFCISS